MRCDSISGKGTRSLRSSLRWTGETRERERCEDDQESDEAHDDQDFPGTARAPWAHRAAASSAVVDRPGG